MESPAACRLLSAACYKIIAVSDSRAAVGAPDGLDIEALLEAKRTIGLPGLAGSNGALGNASAAVPAGGGSMTFSSFGGSVAASNLASYSFAVAGA